jgi:dihydrofolate reductase
MFKVKMSTPNLTAIVAATKSNGIGLNGGLPWRLPGEMKYFAKGKSEAVRPTEVLSQAASIARL